MKVSRREFSKSCAIATTGLAMGKALAAAAGAPAVGQVEGEHINTSSKHPVPSIQDTETPEQKNARMKWFREARFGMFIHWGLYAIPAGRWNGQEVPGIGEWIMNRASIPVSDYKALSSKFNPTEFKAAEIVGLAALFGIPIGSPAALPTKPATTNHQHFIGTPRKTATSPNISRPRPFRR